MRSRYVVIALFSVAAMNVGSLGCGSSSTPTKDGSYNDGRTTDARNDAGGGIDTGGISSTGGAIGSGGSAGASGGAGGNPGTLGDAAVHDVGPGDAAGPDGGAFPTDAGSGGDAGPDVDAPVSIVEAASASPDASTDGVIVIMADGSTASDVPAGSCESGACLDVAAENVCGATFEEQMRNLLPATLRSVAWHIDPITGIVHDHLDWKPGGNDYQEIRGVIPQMTPESWTNQGSNNFGIRVERSPDLAFDTAFELSYQPSHGAGTCAGSGATVAFGYVDFPFKHNLAAPAVKALSIRGRSPRPDAQLEIKIETSSGCQVKCITAFNDTLETKRLALDQCDGAVSCDLSQSERVTFAATDDEVGGCSATWTIDQLVFEIDPAATGDVAGSDTATACTGDYQPLPCGSSVTGADKIGYALLALAAGACTGIDTAVVGFAHVEDALLAGLTTLGSWRKWHGEAANVPLTGTDGFPWTWIDPSTGLPLKAEVFGIDSANLAASLATLAQMGPSTCPSLVRPSASAWGEVASKAQALYQAMDWSWMNVAAKPVLGWCAHPGRVGFCSAGIDSTSGLSTNVQSARSDESILRTFLAIAGQSIAAEYWESGLRCGTRTIGGAMFLSQTDASQPVQCDPTFFQQASAIFMDLDKLPVPAPAGIGHRDSLVNLMKAAGIGQDALAGYSDCESPTGDTYYAVCSIPSDLVTPQAAVLGLDLFPSACRTIQQFLTAGVAGAISIGGQSVTRGFRDSVWTANGTLDSARPYGAQVFLSLDQSRQALALVNYLDNGLIRRLFEATPGIAEAYQALVGKVGCLK
jgi:hypothetical protein